MTYRRRSATLAQVVADALRHALREGQYLCGERVTELGIAHEFNVSQNTVRDALHLLAREGWLRERARRGAVVRAFNGEEAEEIYRLWATIEPLAYGWAAEHHNRVDLLGALRPPVEAAQAALNAEDMSGLRAALFGFHHQVAQLAGRPQTAELLAQLHHQAYLMEVYHMHHRSRPQTALIEWVAGYDHLLGIIKFGEVAEVQQALSRRIMDNGRPIIRWLAMTT